MKELSEMKEIRDCESDRGQQVLSAAQAVSENPKPDSRNPKQARSWELGSLVETRIPAHPRRGRLGEATLPRSFRGRDAWPHASGQANTSAKCPYRWHGLPAVGGGQPAYRNPSQHLAETANTVAPAVRPYLAQATQSKTRRPLGARDLSRFHGFPSHSSFVIRHSSFTVALCLLLAAFCLRAWGQSFSIDWWTVDGGGGTSTGGVYILSGTIGQPDAGPTMTGGSFALTGGFWAITAVQEPGAPVLSVRLTATNTVMVWWPSPSAGWVLRQNTDLNTTNWVTPPEPIQDDGTNRFIIVNPPVGNRFYRLHKP